MLPFHAPGAWQTEIPKMTTPTFTRLDKTNEEWRKLLTPAQFRVLRSEGTEVCGTHPFNREKRAGTFVCAGCFLPLFESGTKFESGTGWPSFWDPIPGRLETKTDHHIGYPRTEYHCARCGGHQGHVFEDGPRPTGLRYCNNGEALTFVPEGEALPALRE
ncbi:peptide-methionine (R)-S-oxide reductase [Panacagrimonas perspica]|uniref:peptide-methionine (R)-S-oxide reductase n=2 Tax=Panacagrimonas perspica TaxID=381431 RepID=A0A4R7P056_9GAMM|nr:peptide-methionine (R)-S-oxide reductase [Panacagrimonas perspica]